MNIQKHISIGWKTEVSCGLNGVRQIMIKFLLM